MSEALFTRLINLIVTQNGNGHKQLEAKVKNGELSESDAAIIKLRAAATILNNKLDELSAKA